MAIEAKAGSILAIDVGTVNTRAVLLDTVGGVHRFIARGEAPTTSGAPWDDIGEGLRAAIRDIIHTTGRPLLDNLENPIIPERPDRSGVDSIVASASTGRPVRAMLVGLVPGVSLESGRRAAEDTYVLIEDVISLADGRTREQQVDAILALDPDLIIIVGGTEGGATQAMSEQILTVAMACLLMVKGNKPRILFAGNTAVQEEVTAQLEEGVGIEVIYAQNVRPSLEREQLDDVRTHLAELAQGFRVSSSSGFEELSRWSETGVVPTAKAYGRLVEFMGKRADWDVLGIDVGSTSTIVAASLGGTFLQRVCSELGIGHGARGVLQDIEAEQLTRWLTVALEDERDAINYAWNKWLYPHTVPQTPDDLELELALARETMRAALRQARPTWPVSLEEESLPRLGEIVAGGAVLGRAPHPGYSALAILDALQPVGVVKLWLDSYGVATALGSVAELAARAAVEVIESGGLLNLGTAVCTAGSARRGQVVLKATLTPEGEAAGESIPVRAGSLVSLPLAPGQPAQLTLQPRARGTGLSRQDRKLDVIGGVLGVIVDARGRPLPIPDDAEERRDVMREWRSAFLESQPS
jgi:hypothetical protein